ncbi:DUF2589 domain-containing protein [Nannocystis sp. SCPEA4]|uniref:DUF2589 domain-containing protein n=1 Tax=Nannocystis sp. SCPEA4 TaxID=2996787 RepID=UPI00227076B1|nr:DUF2589 domain-containing protein [Nannocystis sp. SCPEA4]MCY1062674.1 DUF2589 domain-containing protein [Nannocystis sp. SCPEA4]
MLNLDGLVAAVQRSVAEAANALAARNIELFHSYFEAADDGQGADGVAAAAEALAASQAARAATDPAEAQQKIAAAAEALERAAEALKSQRGGGGPLRPRTTAIQYPHMTKDGPGVHTVHVPLIALAPISFAQLTELRLKTDLELSVQGESVIAGVPAGPRATGGEADGEQTERRAATLEIVLGELPSSQGLRLIIEGYERALRAQIPG